MSAFWSRASHSLRARLGTISLWLPEYLNALRVRTTPFMLVSPTDRSPARTATLRGVGASRTAATCLGGFRGGATSRPCCTRWSSRGRHRRAPAAQAGSQEANEIGSDLFGAGVCS